MWSSRKIAAALVLVLGTGAALVEQQRQQQQQQPQRPLLHQTPGSSTPYNRTEALLSLHQALVEIESTSGNEHAIGTFLAAHLAAQNLTVERQAVPPAAMAGPAPARPRFNVLAYPGGSRRTRVLLTSHMDTVPASGPAYSRDDEGGTVWGRGSADAKGSIAAQAVAAAELARAGEIGEGDAGLLFVVGEETGGEGMRAAAAAPGLAWETVVFGEPTALRLAAGHKGILSFRLAALGRAGHSGYPELARSAVDMLLPALRALERMPLPRSARFGHSTLNVGTLRAGVAANVVPASAGAEISIRLAAGTAEEAERAVRRVVAAVDDRLELTFYGGYGPVPCDADVEGFDTVVVNYGTDIPNLKGDHRRHLYGPGSILVAHSDHEHVAVSDLVEAVDGYKRLVRAALKRTPREKE